MRRLLGLPLAIASLLVTSAAAHAYAPDPGGIFNNPLGKYAAKWRLMNHVDRAIANTPAGETILIATYLFDHEPTIDKLTAAFQRGVTVQVVADGSPGENGSDISAAAQKLRTELNTVTDDPSWFVSCQGSCRGSTRGRNMHSKFYAFSRSGEATDVVMVSSANLNGGGALLGWNDLFTVVNKPDVYAAFAEIHHELAQDTAAAAPYREFTAGSYQMRFFPQAVGGEENDPTYADLANVKCRGVTDGAGRDGRTLIKVAMFWWSDVRGMYLAQRLIDLDNQGCDVVLVYGAPSKDVAQLLKTSARSGGVEIYDTRYDRNDDGKVDLRVHSKYLLINGNYRGDTSARHVTVGSQNWGQGSLNGGDELTMGVASRSVYSQYVENFNFLRTVGRKFVR